MRLQYSYEVARSASTGIGGSAGSTHNSAEQVRSERAAKKSEFGAAGESGPLLERVVADRFYRIEHCKAATAEQFDIDAGAGIDAVNERQPTMKQIARPSD